MNPEGTNRTILWASTFLSRKGARVTPEKQIVIGGTLGRKAEREAQKIRRIQLLFISGTTSTSAVIVVRRTKEGVQVGAVQDFQRSGPSDSDKEGGKMLKLHSSLLEQLSNDTTAFLLKYGVGEITPAMHATQLQNLLQQMYKTDTPLLEPRNAFSHYVYCFGINRIWQILHARPTGSDNPFIALFLSCESASELTKSEFRGRSQNTRSLPKDLEREDESRLSEYVDGLPGTKSNGRPLQFELTEWQAWQLVTKFKSCLGRIQSTASMIKRLVQGRPDAEKPIVTVTDRLLLTGAVKLLAANMQILGWLVHHSSSFWKLLDSLEPVFTKRMAELRRMANDINGCNRDNEHPNSHSLAWSDSSTKATRMGGRSSSEDEDVSVGADSVRSWLKQLTEYHHLLYDLSEGPRANGVIGGRVEINVHILPKIPQESLVSTDEILEALNETGRGHAAWSKLGPLVRQSCKQDDLGQFSLPGGALHCEAYLASLTMTGKVKRSTVNSAGDCCFCCSRLLELSNTGSTGFREGLPVRPWIPPDATPMKVKRQILDDLAKVLGDYLDEDHLGDRSDLEPQLAKEAA